MPPTFFVERERMKKSKPLEDERRSKGVFQSCVSGRQFTMRVFEKDEGRKNRITRVQVLGRDEMYQAFGGLNVTPSTSAEEQLAW